MPRQPTQPVEPPWNCRQGALPGLGAVATRRLLRVILSDVHRTLAFQDGP
jgi:hypothetical protein